MVSATSRVRPAGKGCEPAPEGPLSDHLQSSILGSDLALMFGSRFGLLWEGRGKPSGGIHPFPLLVLASAPWPVAAGDCPVNVQILWMDGSTDGLLCWQ